VSRIKNVKKVSGKLYLKNRIENYRQRQQSKKLYRKIIAKRIQKGGQGKERGLMNFILEEIKD